MAFLIYLSNIFNDMVILNGLKVLIISLYSTNKQIYSH
jgi:hypothetical protein